MNTVINSRKFQAVIPQRVREALKWMPGEKMRALRFGNRAELIEVQMSKARGLLA